MRRLKLTVVVAALLLVSAGLPAAFAQDVTTITAYGEVFNSRISPDGRLLATFEDATYHGEVHSFLLPIRVYDLERGAGIEAFDGQTDYARDVAFSPDGRLLAALYPVGWIDLWEIETGERIRQLPVAPDGGGMQWIPGTQSVAVVAARPLQIQIWDTETGHMTRLMMERPDTFEALREQQMGVPDGPAALRVSPDGSEIAVATLYGRVIVWDVATGEPNVIYDPGLGQPSVPMTVLQYSADGQRLYTLDRGTESLLALDAGTGESVMQIAAEKFTQRPLAISPDGRRAAWLSISNSAIESIQIADLDTGEIAEIPSPLAEDTRVLVPLAGLYFDASGDRLYLTGAVADPASAIPYDNAIYVLELPQ